MRNLNGLMGAMLAVALMGPAHPLAAEQACAPPNDAFVGAAGSASPRDASGRGAASAAPQRKAGALHEPRSGSATGLFSDARAMNHQDERAQAPPRSSSMPEPPGWTMLLSALLIVAFIAHRRAHWPAE